MAEASATASSNKLEKTIITAAVLAVCALAWVYVVIQAERMSGMGRLGIATHIQIKAWSGVDVVLLFVMWTIMMIGMMLPSAVPLIHRFTEEWRQKHAEKGLFGPTALLALGYIAVWTGFSVVATIGEMWLHDAALLSPSLVSTSVILSGALLVAAGIYQLTPMQYNLLKRCRQPLYWLRRDWREGAGGAFVMGLEHGAWCVGCCFVLMGVLFVGGVMNLLLLAAVAVFVLIEKALPFGNFAGLVSGPLMIAAGLYLLF